jgi:hypothetical protein
MTTSSAFTRSISLNFSIRCKFSRASEGLAVPLASEGKLCEVSRDLEAWTLLLAYHGIFNELNRGVQDFEPQITTDTSKWLIAKPWQPIRDVPD